MALCPGAFAMVAYGFRALLLVGAFVTKAWGFGDMACGFCKGGLDLWRHGLGLLRCRLGGFGDVARVFVR
jgi:hypothetical protein